MSKFQGTDVSAEQGDAMRRLANLAETLASTADKVIKNGRYKALFQTHLETAMIFADKAIAKDGLNDE